MVIGLASMVVSGLRIRSNGWSFGFENNEFILFCCDQTCMRYCFHHLRYIFSLFFNPNKFFKDGQSFLNELFNGLGASFPIVDKLTRT
jgi:hypothetical protein